MDERGKRKGSLAEILPGVCVRKVSLHDVIVGLSVSVPASNGVDVSIMDHGGHAGARVPHVSTEVPAALHRVIALHGGVVDGSILPTNHIDLPVHCTGTGSRASNVHVRN